jgi:adenylate cyclase
MAETGPERRLAAVVAFDMVGYSRLMEVDEVGTLARLKAHRIELIDPAITKNRGRIIKTIGDGMLMEFHSVVDAVACAAEIQRLMARRNADISPARWIQFRIGINLGDVIVEEDDIFGDGVNVAARLETLAEPGGICVSGAVHDQVGGRLEASDILHALLTNVLEDNVLRRAAASRRPRMIVPNASRARVER